MSGSGILPRGGRRGAALRARCVAAALLALVGAAAGVGVAPPPGNEPFHVGYGTLQEEWRGEVVRLSWRPRAFLFKRFLSDEECDHLTRLSRPSLTKSTVVDMSTGKPMDSNTRTSKGTFFQRGHDAVIKRIEERVAAATMVPVENQEGLQMLHYEDGQKYEPHMDWFMEKYNQDEVHGGQRLMTLLMYLSTPEEGGETVFPDAEFKSSGPGLSDCARKGLANKPVKGDALLFYSLTPDGKEDPMSLHGSCPTTKGEKWSATKWIHVNAYGGSAAEQKAKWGDCVDANESCPGWAKRGECASNPAYMRQSCRLSCGECKPSKHA
ncbi:prolyl 4-hydroxylase-like protein [Raphidocelis subcapitata]|uniref:procollagen-proline 4-dioxygenase n=1 Tax=Raphidocelis subcapitata TaxID=307507 RepID=A0A2V0NUU4_9CHLO|nr:prolyl 4-hydroxylase-like protein [Raphidocelis subcapitata]|eukprot:GBF89340.1 prolyl 4-hydroxylase-like protein [Raphidocelis subcapitata]